jgi:hypothetical protein
MAHNTETIFFVGIDRPRSFRDDIQRTVLTGWSFVSGPGRFPGFDVGAVNAFYAGSG